MSHMIALVVDDETSVRGFIVAVLQGDGFQTIEAENGDQALEMIRRLGTDVDLVVSDIRMPLIDGITLAYWVRAHFPAMPLVLVSGYAEIEEARLPNTGFEFVQIPFDPTILLSTVEKVMRLKRTPPSSAPATAS